MFNSLYFDFNFRLKCLLLLEQDARKALFKYMYR